MCCLHHIKEERNWWTCLFRFFLCSITWDFERDEENLGLQFQRFPSISAFIFCFWIEINKWIILQYFAPTYYFFPMKSLEKCTTIKLFTTSAFALCVGTSRELLMKHFQTVNLTEMKLNACIFIYSVIITDFTKQVFRQPIMYIMRMRIRYYTNRHSQMNVSAFLSHRAWSNKFLFCANVPHTFKR